MCLSLPVGRVPNRLISCLRKTITRLSRKWFGCIWQLKILVTMDAPVWLILSTLQLWMLQCHRHWSIHSCRVEVISIQIINSILQLFGSSNVNAAAMDMTLEHPWRKEFQYSNKCGSVSFLSEPWNIHSYRDIQRHHILSHYQYMVWISWSYLWFIYRKTVLFCLMFTVPNNKLFPSNVRHKTIKKTACKQGVKSR